MGSPDRPDTAWRDQAACLGADPRIFTDPRPDTNDTRQAVAHCRRCPVRQPCLTTALTHHPDADIGIWGGTTPETRTTIRRRRRPPAQTEPAIGLFPTLDGDLTDLSGRALVVALPAVPELLLLIDGAAVLRTDRMDDIRQHLTRYLADYRPSRLAPLTIAASGDLIDPTGRITITRVPTPPHLLVVVDGRPRRRASTLHHARQVTICTRLTLAALPDGPDRQRPHGHQKASPGAAGASPDSRHVARAWIPVTRR